MRTSTVLQKSRDERVTRRRGNNVMYHKRVKKKKQPFLPLGVHWCSMKNTQGREGSQIARG